MKIDGCDFIALKLKRLGGKCIIYEEAQTAESSRHTKDYPDRSQLQNQVLVELSSKCFVVFDDSD